MARQILQLVSGKTKYPLSPQELKDRYFFGIPIIDQQGRPMPDDTINSFIEFAVSEIETYLEIKLSKQIVKETLDYSINDWKSWGYIPTTFPVLEVYSLKGKIGQKEQIEFPKDWLSIKRSNDPYAAHRKVSIIPNIGSANNSHVVYSGITPHLGWFSMKMIPDYWVMEYCTSFERIPPEIIDIVGKLASVNIFHSLGDIILGAGIASQSIGIDGLSQSISTTSSAENGGYSARIKSYLKDLEDALPRLKRKYLGISFLAV